MKKLFYSLIVGLLLSSALYSKEINIVTNMTLSPTNKLWISGTSTLHPWHSTANGVIFRISADLPDQSFENNNKNDILFELIKQNFPVDLEVEIPIKKIKSHDKGLDKNLQKTLKAEKYPTLSYQLKSYTPVRTEKQKKLVLRTQGYLTLNNIINPMDMEVILELKDSGLNITGSKVINMTDHQIKPPVILFFISVGDAITASFDFILNFSDHLSYSDH